jgi:hypothetical protein
MFAAAIPLILLTAFLPGVPPALALWTGLAFCFALLQFLQWALLAAWQAVSR